MLDKTIGHFRGVGAILSLFYSIILWEILFANNVDPDQMPHYVLHDTSMKIPFLRKKNLTENDQGFILFSLSAYRREKEKEEKKKNLQRRRYKLSQMLKDERDQYEVSLTI